MTRRGKRQRLQALAAEVARSKDLRYARALEVLLVLISESSPLRKVPRCEPTQQLFLDGIRFTIEMVELSFTRLCTQLWQFSDTKVQRQRRQHHAYAYGAALLDAWSVVDSIERLRTLILKMRGLKRTRPIKEFLANSSNVRPFRNRLHHLNEDLANGLYIGKPVLGCISWVTYVDTHTPTRRIFVLTPGALTHEVANLVNPVGVTTRAPLDLVTLFAHGAEVSLTNQMQYVASIVQPLETAITDALGHLPPAGGDMLFSCDCTNRDEEPVDPQYVAFIDGLRNQQMV